MDPETKNKGSVIAEKSFVFAVRIVRLYRFLVKEYREYVLSKQVLKAGTSIGANVHEGRHAQSRNDFLSKMNMALKEAVETEFWLKLPVKTEFLT